MFSEMPLLSGWQLTADALPEEMTRERESERFVLPGAADLLAFADLLGGEEAQEEAAEPERREAVFSLPGMFPDGVRGCAVLSREIDFGRLMGEYAQLTIDHLCGAGSVRLGEETLTVFHGGTVRLELTDALRLGRRQMLSICFDDAQGAGVCGAVILKTGDDARIEDAVLSADAGRQTLDVSVSVHAGREGDYVLRAALAGTQDASDAPWREMRVSMQRAGKETLSFSLSMHAPRFEAGRPYVPPVLKLMLYRYEGMKGRRAVLMDARTLMTGYAGERPRAYIPLTEAECRMVPDALIGYAKKLCVAALYVPKEPPALLMRCAALEGTALLTDIEPTHAPCVFGMDTPDQIPFSPAAACWQLCGMPSMPPVPDAQAKDRELMMDAAGREIDMQAQETKERMARLRALQIRLQAEAARQGQFSGALCMPGEWKKPEIAKALESALSPLHLSVLPLRGAWWTQSFFSATLQAFIPPEMKNGTYAAEASLVNEEGERFAFFRRDVNLPTGPLGIIEGRLPDHACVLTLQTKLLRSGAVVEMQEIPVYVGERGPLEAAFD